MDEIRLGEKWKGRQEKRSSEKSTTHYLAQFAIGFDKITESMICIQLPRTVLSHKLNKQFLTVYFRILLLVHIDLCFVLPTSSSIVDSKQVVFKMQQHPNSGVARLPARARETTWGSGGKGRYDNKRRPWALNLWKRDRMQALALFHGISKGILNDLVWALR